MMQLIPYSNLKKGTFLIASPNVTDSVFFRSVILLCDHSPVGSFGVILNKPLEVEASDILSLTDLPDTLMDFRSSGPNQSNQLMILHSWDKEAENNLDVCPGVYLGGDLEMMQEMFTSEPLPNFLLCLGYCSWSAGVLEKEFLDGAWFLHPASQEHVFNKTPESMWQTLLREMGGKYKTLSMIPEDLELN